MKITMWIPDDLAKELGKELLFSDNTDDRVLYARADEIVCTCDCMIECDGHTVKESNIEITLEEPSETVIALGEALTSGPGAMVLH